MSKKSSSFLPNYFQTDKNNKFLSSTVDEFFQTPELERIDGYIGSKLVPNFDIEKDNYLKEQTKDKTNYQLEPALVIKDNDLNIDKVVFYEDIIKQIGIEGGFNNNLAKAFKSTVYTFSPPIDWDKLINYDQYYWLPKGPEPIYISTSTVNNIVGQLSYTMSNGYQLSNGMKLIFDQQLTTGTTTIFSNTEYIVEGVGKSIKLVDFTKLQPNLNLCSITNETFDNNPFDYFGFDSDGATPLTPDYITINKSSMDLNPWTRYNRWFHRSVITTTAVINSLELNLDNTARAKRPIIEFNSGIQLYNFGKTGIQNVDLIDTETVQPLTAINGQAGFYIDQELLEAGYNVIFANNEDINDRNKVYRVGFTNTEFTTILTLQTSTTAVQTYVSNLIEDGIYRSSITITSATNATKYSTSSFITVSTTPITMSIPGTTISYSIVYSATSGTFVQFSNLFGPVASEVVLSFDKKLDNNVLKLTTNSNYSINDKDNVAINLGATNSSHSFYFDQESNKWIKSQGHDKHNQPPLFDLFDEQGSQLNSLFDENNFAGTKIFGYEVGNGTNDAILGFPVSFNQNLIGIGSFNFKNYFSTDAFDYVESNVPYTSDLDGYYYKVNTGTYTLKNIYSSGINHPVGVIQNFEITTSTSSLFLTCFDSPISSNNITVTAKVNDKISNPAYIITSTFRLDFSPSLSVNDFVSVKVVTTQTANANGYYETVPSLTNNPFNEKITTVNYSQLLDYVGSMIPDIGLFQGSYPGESNLRNFDNISQNGDTLIANEGSVSFVKLFLGNDNSLISSLKWVGEQYNTFKQNFLRYAIQYNYGQDPIAAVDEILFEMFKNKLIDESFYGSDMVAFGNDKVIKEFTIVTTSTAVLPVANNFDLQRLSFESILIYRNGNQLLNEVDYQFDYDQASVSINTVLDAGDKVEIHYYASTLGSFVPPTPTKHGLYLKYTPEIFDDYRYVDQPVKMIRGHDGSLIKSFGDYRDDLILELEKRIYNNIKTNYNKEIFDIFAKIPGGFRTTEYTKKEFESILEKDFAKWATKNSINYSENTTSDYDVEKSWNYIDAIDQIRSHKLNGSFRAIFKFLYDTDRPDTHPWECLGFTSKPAWWDARYGTQYNFFNNLMWTEVLSGIIADPDNPQIDLTFDRQLAKRPVTPTGEIERVQNICYAFESSIDRTSNWEFGDFGPAEVVWRNSSYYPFSVQVALCLLYPLEYLSKLFDLSRVNRNAVGQLVWKEDNKFLSVKKLLVEGYNTSQISGYGNFFLEYGSYKSKTFRADFAQSLENLDMNLSYKVSGFTSQDKLHIKINAVDPESTSPGLILPKEDYKIRLYQSNPIQILDISGIIIKKLGNNSFSVKGYNREKLSFTIYQPIFSNNPQSVQVGGKSEQFSEWTPYFGEEKVGLNRSDLISSQQYNQKFYKQGQVVRYNNQYYRVKVSHNAAKEFNVELFQRLRELPYAGGVRVSTTNKFNDLEVQVPYETVFNSVQDVYNFIIGYGNYLERQGFVFDYYNKDLSAVLDWHYSAMEFLFWSTQNWAAGNLITLSPFADYIKFNRTNLIVDDIFSSKFEYSLQNANGIAFEKEFVNVTRSDNEFTLRVTNTEDGIFFARLVLIQKEHILIFNNTTIFNDTIFDKPTGYRQKRVKLSGFKTKNWNGDLSSPGFLFYKGDYSTWTPYKKYSIGDVVKYNTKFYQATVNNLGTQTFEYEQWALLNVKYDDVLLPNFDYKINQFEDFYSVDIDNFDIAQQSLAQHLIGYTPRNYLNKIIIDPIAQYKFYQGFIKDKGTKNVLSNIVKVNEDRENSSIELLEEWAFRVGEYGSFITNKELEFQLDEGRALENPYLIKLSDSVFDNSKSLIHYTSSTDILIKPNDFSIDNVFYTSTGTFEKNITKLINAGYVRFDDVTTTAYNKDSILDIANNGLIQNGDTVWLGFLENGDWTVYRYYKQRAQITGVYVSSPGISLTFATNIHHNLSVGDIVSVVNFNQQVNGVYKVVDIPNLVQFTVASSIAGVSNEPLLSFGSLFKFELARFENFEQWSLTKDQFNLSVGSKIWIDKDTDSKWAVYEKIDNYENAVEYNLGSRPIGQKFGWSLFATTATDVVLIGAPTYHMPDSLNYGKVRYYKQVKSKLQTLFDIELNYKNNYASNTATEFGYSLGYDIGKGLMFIGAPAATNVRATTSTSTLICISSSTFIPSRTNINEGLLKITSKNFRSNGESTKVVLAQPFATSSTYLSTTATLQNSRFGHSIYNNQVEISTSTTLLVGAPGNTSYTGSGTVFAYKINLLDVDNLDFDLDSFVNENKGDYTFIEYKTRAQTILPYFVSNNLYVINGENRYGLFRDPSNQELASVVDYSLTFGIIGQTEETNIVFFVNLIDQNYFNTFDYDRSRTENKLYQKKGTIDVRSFFANSLSVVSTSSITLNAGAKWGYAISGDRKGNNIAISAPGYFANGVKGIVQIFDKNLQWKQTVNSPLSANDEFGISVKISDTGRFLFVGSSKSFSSLETYGKVAVYQQNSEGQYDLSQILVNPVFNSDLTFGHSISISEDENTLVVSSLGTNKSEVVKFYLSTFSQKGETTFDNNQTKFVTVVPNAGAVYAYQNFDDLFVQADELLPDNLEINGKYGQCVAVTNKDIFVGAPSYDFYKPSADITKIYKFAVKDISKTIWNKIRYQEDLVDIDKIKRVSLIDNKNEIVLDYLDVYDPIKGKIPGIADQEIKFKSAADPAIYSIGIAGTVNDNSKNWLDEHVGELWWDLSTAKYSWYEQGTETYRKNNWGRLFPGSSIDVYEWVKSTLTPSEWANQADTSNGLTKGISGQPKFSDNTVISVKQVLNTVTGSFENIYYFWVKNKSLVPNIENRRISALDVSRLIADPVGFGFKHAQVVSKNSLGLANVQSLLVGKNTSLNIISDEINNSIPLHTEWQLTREGDVSSLIPTLAEKKIIDSLVGIDDFGNNVPKSDLNFRNRYGLSVRPIQTVFVNRFEALRNLISFVNEVLIKNRIYGIVDFENLNATEPPPLESEGEYDYLAEDRDILDLINTDNFRKARIYCTVNNGVITNVIITDPGYGYAIPPKITITPNVQNKTKLKSYIDSEGRLTSVEVIQTDNNYNQAPTLEVRSHAVLISLDSQSNNRWSLNSFDYDDKLWVKIRTQLYNTSLYWDYVDYKTESFNIYKSYTYVLDDLYELNKLTSVQAGEYIKILNMGNGRVGILEKTIQGEPGDFSEDWNIVYNEKATVQFADSLWNIGLVNYGFDKSAVDQTLYDQLPNIELKYIIKALKDDIFINDLKIYWNLFFFNAVKFALTEQKFLDWAFKTSFVVVKNKINNLNTPPTYSLDSSQYFEDFVKEAKPFRTKIRNFVNVNPYQENANTFSTDFDVPTIYDETFDFFKGAITRADLILDPIFNEEPYKTWKDNNKFYVKEVKIYDGGTGYTSAPLVSFGPGTYNGNFLAKPAIAKSYIRNGAVYKVDIIYGGEGYEVTPLISFTGGNPTVGAKASVIIANETTRKNLIGIKFDRYSTTNEVINQEVTYTFPDPCDGSTFEFTLPFRADTNKQYIFPTLDKKLVLGNDYRIEEYNVKVDTLTTTYSKFIFTNYVPKNGQIFKIIYKKHISLSNAIDRINEFYNPTDTMVGKNLPLLMKGLEYPYTQLQGLKFDYSTPLLANGTETDNSNTIPPFPNNWLELTAAEKISWYNDNNVTPDMLRNIGVNEDSLIYLALNGYKYSEEVLTGVSSSIGNVNLAVYDNGGGWNDLTMNYAKAKVIATATVNSSTLYLNSVAGIIPGQAVNFISTSTLIFRTGTVVTSVITATNAIEISSPTYSLSKIYSLTTTTGSYIKFQTADVFNGNIKAGDRVVISGVTSGGYNGTYTVLGGGNEPTRNAFMVTATNLLSTTGTIITTGSVRVLSLLQPIEVQNKLIGTYNFYLGPCKFPEFTITASSPSVVEGYTATFTIDAIDITQVDFGLGRTFGFYFTGNNISPADIDTSGFLSAAGNSATISTVIQALPYTFTLPIIDDGSIEGVETLNLNLFTYISTQTASTATVASTSIQLRDRPTGAEQFYLTASGSFVNEGDSITYSITGTNVNFGSNGRVFRVYGSGTNITAGDIVGNSLVSPDIVLYSADEFPYSFPIDFAQDYITEGSESFTLYLETWLNILETTTSTYSSSATVTILDSAPLDATYQLVANSSVNEGFVSTITLITTNLTVGQTIPYVISTVSGQILVAELGTPSYGGNFTLSDSGTPGTQVSTLTFTVSTADGYEPNDVFRLSLTNVVSTIGLVSGQSYIDVAIIDQVVSNFGQVPSTVYSRTSNQERALASVRIRTTGSFNINIATTSSIYPSGINVTPIDQIWANPPTGLSSYYVRAIVDPYDTWVNTADFNGPGFTPGAVTANYFNTNGYAPVVGTWVTVSTAESSVDGWISTAKFDGGGRSYAAYYLTVQIAETSGGTIIASGTYNVLIESQDNASAPLPPGGFLTNSESSLDRREEL